VVWWILKDVLYESSMTRILPLCVGTWKRFGEVLGRIDFHAINDWIDARLERLRRS
jgi:hypothetical protein